MPDRRILVRAISVECVGEESAHPLREGTGVIAHCGHTLPCCQLALRGNGTIARGKWGERGLELFLFIILFLFFF